MNKPATLSIIGCGKVGQTLGRLLYEKHAVEIQDILNRSTASGMNAITFIGAGRVANNYDDLRPADIFLIAAPDDQIAACCESLANANCLSKDSIVFHCSGALPSSILQAASAHSAAIASIHPIRSFAVPEKIICDFADTYCGVEGDQRALDILTPLFTAIGAQLVTIKSEEKILYHAAAVFASNYLVTLLDTAVQTYGQAGIPQDVALKMMAALVRETTENVLKIGPEKALTGPIVRGDIKAVLSQYRAVISWNKPYGLLYKKLGSLTARLAFRSRRSK
ncbi:Rossmann-like and DUF2520 domain-containing protein [Herminiimonas fonticola]|uniref:Putative short-subunit dehydrogenase-like oxidoreductase (DUF2520 family) n=1 Tax=Herminiimonas fonticola TaxID=303380 RepID=A0A4R6G6J1_9BURK|nr:Rossmann-like and DUF2520 domain-containing protein [Herminiimonas fonticola]RBA24168.1 hypothetical protein Hfont_1980 [Herminiimonas fonticola]TDN90169.1 putative short-subunit dehydrogenase-like oxidoreductase (DUF2520 family) [Herminiimonas fonticola]